jgi:hypothetical protein
MVHHIRAQDSNYETLDDVDAFTGTGPDTLIVDNGASLIASGASADGAFLLDPWTATINGVVAGLATGSFGISLHETNNNNSTASTIKIGASGDVFGDDTGIFVAYSTGNDHVSVTNLGIVSGGTNSIFSPVQTLVRNAGLLDGSVASAQQPMVSSTPPSRVSTLKPERRSAWSISAAATTR